jgi:hypothetical protein
MTDQDEAELDDALAATSTQAFLVREAIETSVSAVADVASETFNATYFRKRGRELLRTLKSDAGSRASVDKCLAFLRGLWGLPSHVTNSKDKDALVLARLCQVWPLKEPRNQHSTHEVVSYHLGIGLNHSCYPNANTRYEMDEGVTLLDGQNFHGSLILYAISDIQIGEEVTIAYVQDTYKPLSHLHHELRTRHGFSM